MELNAYLARKWPKICWI
ncbi:MAG: hypothetical protein LBB34_01735 [Holosporales bacterium]|nr:hypothetical protein [Holosporales bacterium]